jgi:hypothetical protein
MPAKPYSAVDVTLPSAFTTLQQTVGTTAVQLTAASTPVKTHPIVKAPAANSGVVYVGNSDAVSPTTGMPLSAGDFMPVPVDDLNKIWLIASAADQKAAGIAGV